MFNETMVYGGVLYKRVPRDIFARAGGNSNPAFKLIKRGRAYTYWLKVSWSFNNANKQAPLLGLFNA